MDEKVKLVVTIPAYNEQSTVGQVIEGIPKEIEGIGSIEVVVIDDGSTDDTARCAEQAGAKTFSFGKNRGLGAAFRQAVQLALGMGADIIVNIDGDGQFNPKHIPQLIEPIISNRADMVTASRFADPKLIPKMPWIKKWGNKRMTHLINRLCDLNLNDVSCGFRAYSRDAALRATLLGGHTYTHEIILDLAYRGLRIVEVPVGVLGVRKVGKSRVAGNLFKYAWHSAVIVLRAFRDYRPMRFFGGISLILFILALLCGGFVAYHYFTTGSFSPYIFVAFFAGGFGFASLLCYITALLAGMINRLRILQDEQLFLLRKHEYATGGEQSRTTGKFSLKADKK
jgi:glycosyltransferase involved in cell wall biosynthesis